MKAMSMKIQHMVAQYMKVQDTMEALVLLIMETQNMKGM